MGEGFLREEDADGIANFAQFQFEHHGDNVTTNVITSSCEQEAVLRSGRPEAGREAEVEAKDDADRWMISRSDEHQIETKAKE